MELNQTLMVSEAPCQTSQSCLVTGRVSWCLEVLLSGSALPCGRSPLSPLVPQDLNGLLPDVFMVCLAVPDPLPIEIKTITATMINPEFLHSENDLGKEGKYQKQ